MSAIPSPTPDSQTRPRIVIAGAGPAAQALVRQLTRTPFAGGITVLSNRDDAPAELLELAALPQVSLRFGQPVSYIDPDGRGSRRRTGWSSATTSWSSPPVPPRRGARWRAPAGA